MQELFLANIPALQYQSAVHIEGHIILNNNDELQVIPSILLDSGALNANYINTTFVLYQFIVNN